MELRLAWTIAHRELRDALRNKWLAFYAIGFTALSIALSSASLASSGYAGLGGFGRTAASLINALLLFVPLLGLSVGAGALVRDRERGTLLYLMSQPVSRAEVFFGTAMGLAIAVVTAIVIGFGLSGLALALAGGGSAPAFLGLAGYTVLLALVSLGLGVLISTVARKSATAIGTALIVWLVLVFFTDLGVITVALSMRPAPETLFGLLVLNPLQVFKLGAIYSLRSTLDTLGAVGQYAVFEFGAGLPILLVGVLMAWAVVSFGLSFACFARQGDL
jgi:Cu-processing system permease protein